MKILILAGGCGKRLWPLSTEQFPKQFVHLGDHESLLRKTVKRFSKKGLVRDVFVITNEEYAPFILEDLQDIDPSFEKRILTEPCSKNTAPAVTWALRSLLSMQLVTELEAILTVPIDHIFSDEDKVVSLILDAEKVLEQGSIISFGVKCTKPETGYGYIKKGKTLLPGYYKAEIFIEKPEERLAKQFFKEGGWLWNVGIFLFSIRTYLEELKENRSILYNSCNPNAIHCISEYKKLFPISIDHAVIEKFNNVRVVELVNIIWSDVGSWSSLYNFLKEDENGRVKLGNVANRDTKKYFLIEDDKDKSKTEDLSISILEKDSSIFILKG